MLEWLFERIMALIVIVIVLYLLYIVLTNGSHYGGVLGDLVNGLISGIGSFITHASAGLNKG
jgi:succinate dehydrogenase hydrophobic anchor subunit